MDKDTGAAKDVTDKIEGAVGDAPGDADTQASGRLREVAGKAQNLYGEVKHRARDATDDQPRLDRDSALAFPIALADGRMISYIGDAANLFGSLTDSQRRASHWSIAIRMLDHALNEPAYLKTATLSLQTALTMDGLGDHMQS
jgi:uncharacterized protein YjbJ (UPF0337 family)